MLKRFRQIAQLFSFKDIRNGLLGGSVVLGGLGLAFLTLYAHRTGNVQLAGTAATASLVFVFIIILFVIPPLARSASAEASQLNLPFEFTTGGAIFIGLLVIVAFAAINTGNNLLFLVLSFTASALLISFFIGNFCLRKLDVKMRFSETIYAGEPTPILVSLHNRKRIFPTFSVVAEVRGKNRRRSNLIEDLKEILPEKIALRIARPPIIKHTLDYFLFVPRQDSIENQVEHEFTRRGKFIIRDFELSTRFPFGFFRHRRRLPAQRTEIVIFPKIEQSDPEILDLPIEAGKLVSAKRGQGQDLFALREYQPHDDQRHIDWKATARSNRLTVREFAAEDELRITIIFDTRIMLTEDERSKTMREKMREENDHGELSLTQKRFESGVSRAASLISHFSRKKASIRVVIDSDEGDFGNSEEDLNGNLRRLALVKPDFVKKFSRRVSDEYYADVADERSDSYIFFLAAVDNKSIPDGILKLSKLIRF
ncbi:MAG: DUF58 domain-containing protein [Pyrinomonadaceae bacterium]|nr:DUF58 domain-containing protein [Pyrinomonadaceae bacterium]